MLAGPANFFFGSFDPGGFITLDKPPLGFWIEALSARIFGYNGVSLLLPGALAAVASVWLIAQLVGQSVRAHRGPDRGARPGRDPDLGRDGP